MVKRSIYLDHFQDQEASALVVDGAATRDTDYDTVAELAGQLVIVQEGSTNADKNIIAVGDYYTRSG